MLEEVIGPGVVKFESRSLSTKDHNMTLESTIRSLLSIIRSIPRNIVICLWSEGEECLSHLLLLAARLRRRINGLLKFRRYWHCAPEK